MTTAAPQTTVKDVIDRPLDRTIEGVVKVNQDDIGIVRAEIEEYIPTRHILSEYEELFRAIAEGPQRPTEGVGIWVSGFFGSGKSSFAKNVGYALRNTDLGQTTAARLLSERLDDKTITSLIDQIVYTQPTTVLMFDVASENPVLGRSDREGLAEIVYAALLRELGYPANQTLAELEIGLEAEGKLDEFLAEVARTFPAPTPGPVGAAWTRLAKHPEAISRTSRVLHQLDPAIYPAADSWAQIEVKRTLRMSVADIVGRTFDLMAVRRPGQGLTVIADEVGQYVGRSTSKIEDLRALVEQFGKESVNRVRRKAFPAPIWFIVTSQERLDEVTSVLDGGETLLPKLMDRFTHRVDLIPADIREVATKRVLGKTAEGAAELTRRFEADSARLETYTAFEHSTRKTEVSAAEFVQFYPFLPHFIDLSIDVMTGIRAKSSRNKTTGAANRTIIKQIHEMLTGEPNLAEAPLGTLVRLDQVYDLVRHSDAFDQTQKIELDRIRQEFGEGA